MDYDNPQSIKARIIPNHQPTRSLNAAQMVYISVHVVFMSQVKAHVFSGSAQRMTFPRPKLGLIEIGA